MLWLDIGNTRIKWQLDDRDGAQVGAAAHAGGDSLAAAPVWQMLPPGTEVWVACVANAALRAQVETLCAEADCPRVQWAVSRAEMAGLQNAYTEPQRLGVDRWLTMLAAWREQSVPVVIIDAGSAITVDWVDEQGQHRGGHIVPGLHLLEQALRRGTAAVRAQPTVDQSVMPGRSTDAAVTNGCLAMAAGYLRYLLQEAWPGTANARLLVCGGDGPALEPFLPRPAEWRAHLVIEGLREYARLLPVTGRE